MGETMNDLEKFYEDFPTKMNDASRNVLFIMDEISNLLTNVTLDDVDKVKLTNLKENLFSIVRKLKMEMMPFLQDGSLK